MNWSEANDSVVVYNRQYLYNYFSQVVWNITPSQWAFTRGRDSSRVLLFCFFSSFSIVLQRLIETCCHEENCYKNVVIICLPYKDPIAQIQSHSSSMIENAYRCCYHSYLTSFLYASSPSPTVYELSDDDDLTEEVDVEMINDCYGFVNYQEK